MARIVGASTEAIVARMDHLGVAVEKNASWLPWLKAEVKDAIGFTPLPEHEILWQPIKTQPASAPALRGLVQRWMWTAASPVRGCTSERSRVESSFGRIMLLTCDQPEPRAWLEVHRFGQRPYEVPVDPDAAWILRFEERQMDADDARDWILEVVWRNAHDTGSELFILSSAARGAARLVLEGVGSAWWVDAIEPAALWMLEGSAAKPIARAYRLHGERLSASSGLVVRSRRPLPLLQAQRQALDMGAVTARFGEGHVVWRGFRDAATARRSLQGKAAEWRRVEVSTGNGRR